MEKKRREETGLRTGKVRGRYDAEALAAGCRAYFEQCREEGRKCTRPGLILSLNLSEETFDLLLNSEEKKYAAVSQVLRSAMLHMRDELEQRGDTKSVFLLKQRCYGGYLDKPVDSAETQVRVLVTFGGEAGR